MPGLFLSRRHGPCAAPTIRENAYMVLLPAIRLQYRSALCDTVTQRAPGLGILSIQPKRGEYSATSFLPEKSRPGFGRRRGRRAGHSQCTGTRRGAADRIVAHGRKLAQEPGYALRRHGGNLQARVGRDRRQVHHQGVRCRRDRGRAAGAGRGAERHRGMRAYRDLLLLRQGSHVCASPAPSRSA